MDSRTDFNLKRKDRLAVLAMLLSGPVGREWVWGLLTECKIFGSTIGAHHEMCAIEGARRVGLKVYRDIQSDAGLRKLYEQAVKEHEARQLEKNTENEK